MMDFCRRVLKKMKLFVLYWTRIVFAPNHFKVSFIHKLKANLFGGFTADQYALYDLGHADRSQYLSEFDWYRSRYINEPFDFAFNNKVVCSEMLKSQIRIPENYYIKNKGILYDFDHGPVDRETFHECLKSREKLFIKPVAKGKGSGVSLLSFEDGTYQVDGKAYTEAEFDAFMDRQDEIIVCECMKQHAYAARLYDQTVNTMRIVTIRDIGTHQFKIYYAVQRIGRSSSIPVDNASRGALVAKIDLDTGTLSEARSLHDLNVYPTHPDSGAQIEGTVIPDWDSIQKQVLQLCSHIPYMEMIAWDLILTDEGLCMIEANTSTGINILQLWGGQRQSELGDFFRHYGVIRN